MFTAEEIQSLNELELSLYNYISHNKEKVIYMRIRDLAKESHVSTTTILRFCKKMDCDGFSEFKVKLRMYIDNEKLITIKDDKTIFLEFLDRTSSESFQKTIDKACKIICDASHVLFIGIGNSGALASYGARYFSSLSKFAVYIDDPFYPTDGKYFENSVTIALSVSGETSTIITHVDRLAKENSKIISITNSKNSTLAKMSDLNISYYVQSQKNKIYDVTTQLPVLYIIETIAKTVHNMIKDNITKNQHPV
jgi:DNA-binding MurR/RpiR family transcriptional regulator